MRKMRSEHPLQTATVCYYGPREVNFGDVFYKIKAVDFQAFREPCVVCKGEKNLTINGVTFRCPCCDTSKEVLQINGFVVHRYRVFKITDKVSSDEWKPSKDHRIKFELYRKVGHGYQWASHSTATLDEDDLCKWLNVGVEELRPPLADKYIFDDYQLAVKAAKALTDKKLKELDDYNALHGSEYQAEFKTENDKKSN